MSRIAFFGLGAMGLPIALNLAKAGHELVCTVHRSTDGPRTLEAAGGRIAASVSDAVKGADIALTIVPRDKDLIDLLTGAEVTDNIGDRTIIVDMTTASPKAIRQVADFYAPRGIRVIDAPVSGGVPAARAGTMTIMGAGDKETFEHLRPLFETIGDTLYYLGAVGNGKMFKCLNNLLSALNCAATADIFHIAQANGMDLDLVYDVIRKSSGDSVMFDKKFPKMLRGDYTPTFTLELAKKDVIYGMELATGVPAPMADTLVRLLENIAPYAGEDICAMAKCVKHVTV